MRVLALQKACRLHALQKGFRPHALQKGFGLHALQKGVPSHPLQKGFSPQGLQNAFRSRAAFYLDMCFFQEIMLLSTLVFYLWFEPAAFLECLPPEGPLVIPPRVLHDGPTHVVRWPLCCSHMGWICLVELFLEPWCVVHDQIRLDTLGGKPTYCVKH
jgi:hypothetical protein